MRPVLGRKTIKLFGILITTILILSAIQCSQPADNPLQKTTVSGVCGGIIDMNRSVFELVNFTPWEESNLKEEILYSSKMATDGSPIMMARIPPDLLRSPDGILWLVSNQQAVRLNDKLTNYPLTVVDIDKVLDVTPTLNEGLIVLGQKGEESVLARLENNGKLVWRRTNLLASDTDLKRVHLLTDFEENAYLYTNSNRIGQIVRINLDNGSLSIVTELKNYLPKKVWIQKGVMFWVNYSKTSRTRAWVSRNLQTNQQHSIESPPSIQQLLGTARVPLSTGGALLGVPETGELIWMGADGSECERLALAGVVRMEDGLAVAIREKDSLRITHWSNGQKIVSSHVGPFPASPRLIYADQTQYYLLHSNTIVITDWAGKPVSMRPSFDVPKQRLQREGSVALTKAIVKPDDSVLLVGSDPQGVYIVRIKK